MLRCLGDRSKWAHAARNGLNIQNAKHFSAQPSFKEKSNHGAAGNFSVGNVYHGFMCTDIQHVKDFNMTAILLKHEKSKTEYLHLERDDPNNVFSINFRTTPFNSSGLPHVLEHTVLCGSKRFPVRDPFFKMLNRSLATFMNAMTGPDYTFYPFASKNEADYRNLQSIYLDAVFQPCLNYLDFLQEGWRLEHTDLNDPNSPLTFKGVVFNEMKGAFSDNASVFGQTFLNCILPDHTYGYVSGGNPQHIPNLTMQDLKDFHRKYYSPSNARIYSYGNFPLEKNLEVCDRLYLGNYEGIDCSHSRVPPQPRWGRPVEEAMLSRYDTMGAPIERQNQIAVGYLMCDITDVYETLLLHVLSRLMMTGPNAPIYKNLIEPNISGGYSSISGYDANMKDTMFLIALQDVERGNFIAIKRIIDETIDQIVSEGFQKVHIESILRDIELSLKHEDTRFGLNLLFQVVPLWNHEGPVMDFLQIGACLDRLRQNLKNPRYLSERVEHYFKRNDHRLTLTVVPEETYEEIVNKRETDLLNKKVSELTDEDRRRVFEDGLRLSEKQRALENLEALPCLALEDIPKQLEPVYLEETSFGSIPVQVCEANTNGVAYFNGILNTSDLPKELKPLIPLFNVTALEMGTKKHSYKEFDQLCHLNTNGLRMASHVSEKIDAPSEIEEGVFISSYCLDANAEAMFSLWSEIFDKPTYDNVGRFKMLIEKYLSGLSTGVVNSGHSYAMNLATALVTPCGALKAELAGLRHIENMKTLLKTETPEAIMKNVSLIANTLLDANRLRTVINLSETNKKSILGHMERAVRGFPADDKLNCNKKIFTKLEPFETSVRCVHYDLNIPVNFCAKSVLTVPFLHPDFAKLEVLAKFLNSKYLHPVVREQNGAYGAGSKVSHAGVFSFYSYRDPNSRVTLDVFDGAADWFRSCPGTVLNEQTLFEAKLGVFQTLDVPVAPFYKGIEYFLHGVSWDHMQEYRGQVLEVTKEDLAAVCDRYLSRDRKLPTGKCVLGAGPSSAGDEPLLRDDGEVWKTFTPASD